MSQDDVQKSHAHEGPTLAGVQVFQKLHIRVQDFIVVTPKNDS